MTPNRPHERALALAPASGRIGAAARLVGGTAQIVVAAVLFALPATAVPTFVFYGTSMLVAALRRTGGCEVTPSPTCSCTATIRSDAPCSDRSTSSSPNGPASGMLSDRQAS